MIFMNVLFDPSYIFLNYLARTVIQIATVIFNFNIFYINSNVVQ